MSLDLGTLTGYLELDDKKFESVLGNLPGKLKMGGAAAKLAAGGLALGIGLAISGGIAQAIEMDEANAKITGALGLTEEQSATVGEAAGSLFAQAYGESITEVNTAIGDVVSSIQGMGDANDETLERMTAKALNFATAFEVDTARSTQVVGQLLSSGLVKDADEAFDLLTSAMQKVPAAVREDVLDAADEYGPFFAQLGLSGQEGFDLLVRSSEKGMYGIDKAGDALKEFTIRATDMSAASGAAYETLGLDQQSMTNELLAGGDRAQAAFDTIVSGIRGIQDPAAQSQAALALFGTPLEDLGTSEIPAFLGSLQDLGGGMEDAAGAADRMGDAVNDNAATKWTQLQRTWDTIVGTVGAALLPALTAVVDVLNENPAVLQLVATALGILALAFIGVTVATWAMNSALLANPITWLVLAIVALIAAVVLLIMHWDEVVAGMTELWAGFVSWFTGVMDGFLAWWNGVWEGFASWVGQVWEGMVAWIESTWSGFVGWLMGIGAAIAGWWSGLWGSVGQAFQSAWNGLINWGISILSGFLAGWRAAWAGLGSFLGGLWSGIVSTIQGAWNGVMGFLSSIPGRIMGFFSGIGSWLWNAGRDLINGLLNGISSLAGTIGSFFLNLLPGWIVGPFKAALGIASPSKLFRGYGRNIVEGVLLGVGDEQGSLDAAMSGLVSVPDGSVAPGGTGGPFGAQAGAQAPVRVSLEGATIVMDVDGRAIRGVIREQVVEHDDEQTTEVDTRAGEVVFS